MSDPLRDPRPAEALDGPERDARIESLLLSGLDQYFAGDYDAAINLWTRVLFFDRQHDRARAYIDRARSALAERQRESEALIHQGLEAFDAGDVEQARRLLADARERGADDMALGVLHRIERLESRAGVPAAARARAARPLRTGRDHPPGRRADEAPSAARWWALAVAAAVIVGVVGWASSAVVPADWSRWPLGGRPSTTTGDLVAPGPLIVPSAGEGHLARARTYFAGGRLRDALRELDRVPAGAPLAVDAERLRARIQRELLALAAAEPAPVETPAPPPTPPDE